MATRTVAPAKKAPRAPAKRAKRAPATATNQAQVVPGTTPDTAPAPESTTELVPGTTQRQATTPAKPPRKAQAERRDWDLDDICRQLRDGVLMIDIAEQYGRSRSKLTEWLGADVERSARAREARSQGAASYDEQAQRYILDATDPLALAKARELAQHLRWRASKLNPKQYGDKLEMSGSLDLKTVDDDELARKAAALVALMKPGAAA